ncbi:MAG TPA: helicase RepA family protein, partial [Geminicoccaceae bacterium]|nr:helicase RepA family protein [Geminicoccaceae bacterium]
MDAGGAVDDDLLLGGVSVAACLAKVRGGDRWHDHLVRLTGHWISRGWSDAEILTLAESLTLPGYGVAETRREVARMVEGARRKWRLPDPEPRLDDRPPLPLEPRWVEHLPAALLPRRRWLLGRTLLRGQLTLRVAPGGVGKSTLALEEAVAVATGRGLTGEPVHETAPAWVYNNEDDGDEMRRRLAAILQRWDVPLGELRGRLAMNSGADRPLLVAKADRAGNVVRLPDVDGCIEHVQRHAIGLLVVDPFAETHEVGENSNEQIRAVAAMFRDIARQGPCAVMLVHHTAKPPQGGSDGHAGNMNAAGGASALVGVARVVQTLFGMCRRDAEEVGLAEEERHRLVRLDDAKANLGPPGGATRWFRREAVAIGNGDEVGVLVPAELAPTDPA